MSDSDRVHEPSPVRLLQAKEDGMVARSGELSRALLTCVILGAFLVFAGAFHSLFAEQIRNSIQNVSIHFDKNSLFAIRPNHPFVSILFFFGSLIIFCLLFWGLQSAPRFRFEKAVPDFGRLSPLKAWNKLFSPDHWFRVFLMTFGFLITLGLAFAYLLYNTRSLASVAQLNLDEGLSRTGAFLRETFIATGIAILVLGIADYVRERIRLSYQLRMTDEERREEARNMEMNPELRRRLMG